MQRTLDKLEGKLDKLDERLDSIDITLGKQHVSLAEHIRRTELLEDDVAPLKKHVAMVHGALKLIGLAGVIVGIIEAARSIFKH